MTTTKLQTAQYLPPEDEAAGLNSPRKPSEAPSDKFLKCITLVVAVAVVACAAVIVVPYFSHMGSLKSTHPIDWFLRYGGAEPDQTFEKFVRDAAKRNQAEMQERFRQSPISQINPGQFDWQSMQLMPNSRR